MTGEMSGFHATTVVSVRHRGGVALAGDGQVSIGQTMVKACARKVRKVYHDRVLAGFAGAAADAFTLFAKFEAKLEEHRGNLPARGRRARQGLADGPGAAAPGGAAGGGGRARRRSSSRAPATSSSRTMA